ncbi:MAG: putative toxin-antitoxin system toxin component, PIN family [Bacteroidia bacterium]
MKKTNKLKVILDTNVFLVSLAPGFRFYWVFESLLNNEYELFVSNEILSEYEEKITERFGLDYSDRKLDFLIFLPNVYLVNPYFNWNLITQDPDDNKFVDCAVAANADFIVSHDKHFKCTRGC